VNAWLDGTPFEAIPGAVAGGLVAGTLLPLLGLWVVLQRVVFLGVTLAQIAAAGVALGLVLDLSPVTFGLASTVLVVAIAGSRQQVTRLGDAALGAGFCVASALSLLFISRSAADLDEVQHVLHGNLIYASGDAVLSVGLTLLAGVAVLGLFFKELLFSSFDAVTAAALGLKARGWQLLLFVVLAVALSVSMRTTGSLLSFAMLVLPALAALRLGLGLRSSFVAAPVLGFVGTLAGLSWAVYADLHVESSITVVLFILLPVCAGWRKHPALGLTLAAAAVAGALAVPQTQTPFGDHDHHHDHQIAMDDPFHVDVTLRALQESDAIRVEWSLHVHRTEDEETVPPAIWLLLTGDGIFHEHLVMADPGLLPPGDTDHTGVFVLESSSRAHRLDGQLWSGPSDDMDSEPLDPTHAIVEGCDVQH